MTLDEVIDEVDSKSRGRTRYEGQSPYPDELLVAEIRRLRRGIRIPETPVGILEELPNGARVLAAVEAGRQKGLWYVLAAWRAKPFCHGRHGLNAEYVVWWLDPVTKHCNDGVYFKDPGDAFKCLIDATYSFKNDERLT